MPAHEQAERQAWRALVLILKAKLEAGITTPEQEFLADMALPGDVTGSEALLPRLDEALKPAGCRTCGWEARLSRSAREVNIGGHSDVTAGTP